ncbi:MAG: site-specific tyrosine recombinase XerD [Bacteroidetes bacterium]|jgi:integrase/recombinase XerD|nr:MAG: site-specific tyrosine recombinase XerD [Bacteroidota bacterium]UCE68421.1 MAG: site-specific tyrosine recombinase XerD [Flavobacteriaceae bacterium]
MNWKDALADYINYLKLERGLAANSIRSYRRDILKLVDFIEDSGAVNNPLDIDRNTLEAFIHQIAETLQPRSQARIISGLRGFFDYLVLEQYREENPMELIEAPKLGRKLPDTLSPEEMLSLISSVDRSTPEGERNRAILETLYGCGLRVSELLDLRLSDLFFEEGFLKVRGKGSKERFVPIGPVTQKYICLYRDQIRVHWRPGKGHEEVLFLNRYGRRLTRAMIFTIVKQQAQLAGIRKKVSPHTFRHSFATHLLQNGADIRAIQQMLGHESITTTEVYMHVDRQHLSEVVNTFHPRNT